LTAELPRREQPGAAANLASPLAPAATLFVNVLATSVAGPLLNKAPPGPELMLPTKVLLVTASVPPLKIAPPRG